MTDVINGVSRTGLFGAIEALKADDSLAQFNFRIENEWIDGGLNRSIVRDFYGVGADHAHATAFTLHNDEPPVLLSGDKGPNPVENLLHALAGCLVTSIVYHAAARGIKIDAVRTRFEGDLDLRGLLGVTKACRNGYREIRVSFDIDGDLTVEQKRDLMAMGPEYSPVFDVVSNGTVVKCRLREDAQQLTAA
jgi:uncharacterized OsmC-like protein